MQWRILREESPLPGSGSGKMAHPAGGTIKFIIQVDNVELSEPLRNYSKQVPGDEATTLANLYGNRYLKPLIREVINEVFRGRDQEDPQIGTGPLHALPPCSTNTRFLDVLNDYELGKIKKRLEKGFSEFGFEVKGLKVNIENEEVVSKRREEIKKSYRTSPKIIVQGGVYKLVPPKEKQEYVNATKEAAEEGYKLLKRGGTAIEAVEAAVRVLENNEHLNAGCGSSLNDKGQVQCDAMIMAGHTQKTGAVISGRHFRNPVSLAKQIMEKSHHCALSGNGALEFAKKKNFPICSPEELISERARKRAQWMRTLYKENEPGENAEEAAKENAEARAVVNHGDFEHGLLQGKLQNDISSDTVSAVAMDLYGNLACALSTGGLLETPEGRVSDAAIVGCGGYANKTGAATVTGHGESIMKMTLAREVVFNMEKGFDAQKSAEDGLKKMKERVNSCGGAIAIDKDGNFGKHFTTNMMALAYIKDEEVEFGIERGKFKKELVGSGNSE